MPLWAANSGGGPDSTLVSLRFGGWHQLGSRPLALSAWRSLLGALWLALSAWRSLLGFHDSGGGTSWTALRRPLLRREPARGQTLSHQPHVGCRFGLPTQGVAPIRPSSASDSGGGTSWTALRRPLSRREPARGQTPSHQPPVGCRFGVPLRGVAPIRRSHQPPVSCRFGVPLRGVAPIRRSSAPDSGGGTSWAVDPWRSPAGALWLALSGWRSLVGALWLALSRGRLLR
jgi:hypothetical protein